MEPQDALLQRRQATLDEAVDDAELLVKIVKDTLVGLEKTPKKDKSNRGRKL